MSGECLLNIMKQTRRFFVIKTATGVRILTTYRVTIMHQEKQDQTAHSGAIMHHKNGIPDKTDVT